uniref:Uncharacterized protein n=1 Tax=Medicago truncatula TaxID=3880 RepID=B7FJ88_MEDTR|nr:unknown [Medicago truncatula]
MLLNYLLHCFRLPTPYNFLQEYSLSENTPVCPPRVSLVRAPLMAKRDDTGDTPRVKDEIKPNGFLCCFSQCYQLVNRSFKYKMAIKKIVT